LLDELGLDDLGILRVSCVRDSGFDNLIDVLGKHLSVIAQGQNDLVSDRPVFLPVDRVFKKAGFGSIITGTLARGKLTQNDSVWILPDQVKARVRKLESFGASVDSALPGQRVAVNLAAKEEAKLQRGAILSGVQLDGAQNLFVVLKSPYVKSERPVPMLAAGAQVRLYHGTSEYQGAVGWCVREAARDEQSYAHIFVREPFFGEAGDSLVVRESDDVITGGIVLSRLRPRWLNRPNTIALLDKLAHQHFADAIEFLVLANREKMVKRDLFNEFLPYHLRTTIPEALVDQGKLVCVSEYVFAAGALQELEDKLLRELEEMERQAREENQETTVSLERLRTMKFGRIDHETFVKIIERLESRGQLKREAEKVCSARQAANQNSPFSQAFLDEIESKLQECICIGLDELTQCLNAEIDRLTAAVRELERRGKARIVAREFVSSSESIGRAHQILAQIWQEKRQISPSAFKERLNVTRKYAMPLLSFFDDELITRRVGDTRVLLKAPKVRRC
jgi:selenocysteine-specific elongation factor